MGRTHDRNGPLKRIKFGLSVCSRAIRRSDAACKYKTSLNIRNS